jgi:hypothetical protein
MFSSLLGALYLQDFVVMLLIAAAQMLGAFLILRGPARSASPAARRSITVTTVLSLVAMVLAHLSLYEGLAQHLSRFWTAWGRGLVLLWGVLSVFWLAAYGLTVRLVGRTSNHSPARRGFLRFAQTALFVAPAAAAGYGMFIQRFRLTLREQRIVLPNLPQALHGLRLVQLTDIHMSPFLSERVLAKPSLWPMKPERTSPWSQAISSAGPAILWMPALPGLRA